MLKSAVSLFSIAILLGCANPPLLNAEEAKPGKADKGAYKQKFKKTKSGLKYRILRKSKGEQPTATSVVTVHYRGWIPDKDGKGKDFDSSYERGKPATFPLNRVVKGWTEGLQLVNKGGMIELIIPPELGYGKREVGGGLIPANSTLRFIVELIEVKAGADR